MWPAGCPLPGVCRLRVTGPQNWVRGVLCLPARCWCPCHNHCCWICPSSTTSMSHLSTSGHAQGYFHLPDSAQQHWAVLEHLRLPHRSSKHSTRFMRGVHPSGEAGRGQVLHYRSSDDTKHTVLSNPHCLAASGKYFYWKPVRIFWKYTLFWGFVIERNQSSKEFLMTRQEKMHSGSWGVCPEP